MDQIIIDSCKEEKYELVDPHNSVQDITEDEASTSNEFELFTDVKPEESAFYLDLKDESQSLTIKEEPVLLLKETPNSLCKHARPAALEEVEVAAAAGISIEKLGADNQPQCSFVELEICRRAFKNGLLSPTTQSSKDQTEGRHSLLMCELCGFKTFHIRSFKYHLVSRHLSAKAAGSPSICCPYCPQEFNEDATYREHLKHHSKRRVFLRCCPHCRLVCHYKKLVEHCSSHLTTSSELQSYSQGHTASMRRCLSLDDALHYMNYSQTSDDNLFFCNLCSFVSDELIAYQQHLMMDHLAVQKIKEGLIKCPHCLFTCSKEQQFNVHLRGHAHRKCHPCRLCSSTFTGRVHLERHVLSHANGFSTMPDEKETGNESNQVPQNKENKTRLGSESETVDTDPCLLFQRRAMYFKQDDVLDKIKMTHLTFEENSTNTKMKCMYCRYSTASWIILIYHYIRKHISSRCDGEHSIQCPHCTGSFLLDEEFCNHMLLHYNRSRYPCPQCQFVGPLLAMCDHFITYHFKEAKLLVPPRSSMSSKSNFSLSGAVNKYTGVNNSQKIYLDAETLLKELGSKLSIDDRFLKKCPICSFSSKGFRRTSLLTLKFHIISHLGSEISSSGDIECPHCPQKYKVEYIFRKHLREAHNRMGKRGLQHCPFCTFTAKGYRPLIRHVLAAHGTAFHHLKVMGVQKMSVHKSIASTTNETKVYVDATSMRQVMMELMSKSIVYPKKCPFCSAVRKTSSYVMRRHIITHLASQRSNDGCIYCPHCKAQFDEENLFRRHLSKTHRDVIKLYCPFCPTQVIDSQISTHLLNVHGSFLSFELQKPKCCPHCNLNVMSQSNLDIHLKKCHLDKLVKSDLNAVPINVSKNQQEDTDKWTRPPKRKRTRLVLTTSVDTPQTALLSPNINSSSENSPTEVNEPTVKDGDCRNNPRSSKVRKTETFASAANESQPTSAANESQSASAANESLSASAANESQSMSVANESQCASAANESQSMSVANESQSTSAANESQSLEHSVLNYVYSKQSNSLATDEPFDEPSVLEESDDISYTMSCPRCPFITADVILYETHLRNDHKFRK